MVNSVLECIMHDGDNILGVSANKGLSIINISSGDIINFNKSDGLYFSEFMLNAFWKNAFGEMMFGTPAGLVVFNPNNVVDSKKEVPVVLTKLEINYLDNCARLKGDVLTIYPKDKTITVHFAGLHYSTSNRVRYRYKLDGYDADWVETNEVKATYTSLPEGHYTFYINATNSDGNWNKIPIAYQWVVQPPYFKTWWFVSLVVIITLALLVLIIRHFAQLKIKKRLRELKIKEEVHREKQRISRDLHDTVGAQITYLISSIDHESTGNEKMLQGYERLGEKARNIMTQLRNVLWVLDKEEVSFADFSRKVSDYALKVLAPTGIRCTLEIEDHEEVTLSPAVVSNLLRITQEALNNIVKHSKATLVLIRFGIKEEILEITIRDNGVGFDTMTERDDHFGIQNMLNRTNDIGGTCQIDASENGVEIQIRVDIAK